MEFKFQDLNSRSIDLYEIYKVCNPNIDICFEKWEKLFNWAFKDNPFRCDNPMGIEVRSSNNDLIGFSSFIYMPFQAKANSLNIPNIGVICILPEYQGSFGIKFVNEIDQKLTSYLCTHSSKLFCMIWGRMGAKEVDAAKVTYKGLVSLKNKISSRGGLFKVLSYLIPYFVYKLLFKKISEKDISRKISSRGDYGFERDLDVDGVKRFFSLQLGNKRGLDKNLVYFKWRYLDHPFSSYFHFVVLKENNSYQGIAVVVKITSTTYQLYEVFSKDGFEKSLLNKTINTIRRKGAVYLSSKYNDRAFEKLLLLYKFEKTEKKYSNLVYKKSNCDTPINIDFCYADLKIFIPNFV